MSEYRYFKCDRCGARTELNNIRKLKRTYNWELFIFHNGHVSSYDLCASCDKSLGSWLVAVERTTP